MDNSKTIDVSDIENLNDLKKEKTESENKDQEIYESLDKNTLDLQDLKVNELIAPSSEQKDDTIENNSNKQENYSKIQNLDNPLKNEKTIDYNESLEIYSENPIVIPTGTTEELADKYSNMDQVPSNKTTKDQNDLAFSMISRSADMTPKDDGYVSTVKDPKREFIQSIDQEVNGKKITISPLYPSFNSKTTNTQLTGMEAVLRMNSLMGKTQLFTFPLWNSGFWVTIKTPTDNQLMYLEYEMQRNKNELGRVTYGGLFRSEDCLLNKSIFNFFKQILYKSPIENVSIDELGDYIKLPDMYLIAWGISCTIWPKGYEYTRADVLKDETGSSVPKTVTGKLDISKLLFVDKKSLSEKQLTHMALSKGGKQLTKEQVLEYQNGFERSLTKEIRIDQNEDGGTLDIVISVPSLSRYFDSSELFINKCSEDVAKLFTDSEDKDERRMMMFQASASRILQYWGHYIKKIVFNASASNEKNEEYSDLETISAWLDLASSDEKTRNQVMDDFKKFIDDTAIAIIAVPSMSEEDEKKNSLPNFPHLIPIHATIMFFILHGQKLKYLGS